MNDRLKLRALVTYKPSGEKIYGDVDFIQIANGIVDRVVIRGEKFKNDLCDIELLFCTGLRDKNGVLIFEGDIVSYYDSYETWAISRVKEVCGAFTILTSQKSIPLYEFHFKHEHSGARIFGIEVIGSIYKNPELFRDYYGAPVRCEKDDISLVRKP